MHTQVVQFSGVGRRWLRGVAVAAIFASGFTAMVAGGNVHAQDGEPSLTIVSPAAGEVVTSDDIAVQIAAENFTIDCSQVGRPDVDGTGHIHVMLDGMTMAALTNFYCSESFMISGLGLAAGPHLLVVDLSTNTHLDMMETAQEIEFDYQPTNVRPAPESADLGEPGVELVSPLDGATVPPVFTVEVKPVNINPSGDLEGKANLPGYGHYHVFVDTGMSMMMPMDDMAMEGTPEAGMMMEGTPHADDMMMGTPEAGEMEHMAMMAMPGMVAMPGTNTFDLDQTQWGPGEHTIWIEPVQNDHTMYETFGHVEFTVIVEEPA